MEGFLDFLGDVPWWTWVLIFLAIVAIRDIFFQKAHTISHNYPVVGHLRYWLESIGPEMRQYFVANNREELPFNRIERSWIYASAKKENNYEIVLLFSNNGIINLLCEVIEITLEDVKIIND